MLLKEWFWVIIFACIILFISLANPTSTNNMDNLNDQSSTPVLEVATFAGGCFWCLEAPFHSLSGVVDVVSGYAGGSKETANYKDVSSGDTDHREAVQVTYDKSIISYEDLLKTFWQQIDPTDEGGQFADRGFQYTTAIFYHNDIQKKLAEESLLSISQQGLFDKPIATKIVPFSTFFVAEEYHQDYYLKATEHYEAYKKASGREDFIEDNWARNEALDFFLKER